VNYRHAYHAGNFADCVKHALLVALLQVILRKDKPFLFLDTHAGIGRYDLTGPAAAKTAESQNGIQRLLQARPPVLAAYLAFAADITRYPGSPAIGAAMLREHDRLVACELHPEDARALRNAVSGVPNISVHERDGYAALKAFLPPPERRALVLIDPPFEQADEFAVLTTQLALAWRRFRTGVYVVWYPIKSRAATRNFLAGLKLSALRDVVTAEFWLREPVDPARLNGCGLLVVNPPFGFIDAAAPILQALQDVLGETGSGFAVERVIDE
jgi:23S rRNA (adenine2030-N6)-methyltransferase